MKRILSIILVALNYVFSFINEKWFDLVLGRDTNPIQQNQSIVVNSGDISGDINVNEEIVSGEIESGEINSDAIESGEFNVTNENIDSGDENIVTE